MKRHTRRLAAGLAAALLLAGCSPALSPSGPELTESERFAAYTREQFCEGLRESALNLNYTLSRPEEWGIERLTEEPFGELDLDFAEWEAELREDREELDGFDRAQLTEAQQLTWDAIDFALTTSEQAVGRELYDDLLGPVSGQHTNVLLSLAEFTFYEEEDLEVYLALLEDLPRYFAFVAEYERMRAEAGLVAAADTLNEAADYCEMIAAAPEDCLLVTGFADRMAELDWLDEAERADYEARNRELVSGPVAEAYAALGECARELAGRAGEPQGVAVRTEDGADYYQLLVRAGVGSERTVEEFQELLAADIQKNLVELIFLYQEDPAGYEAFFTTVPAQDQLAPEEIIAELREASKEDFPALAELPYTVKEVPAALEEYTSPAFFMVPPIDSQDKNTIYINKGSLDASSLFTTLAHEGYPGHLYQTVYTQLLDLDPLNDQLATTGYAEGWATYVEYEYGYAYLEESETYRRLARVNALLSLEVCALADIGVNWAGWDEAYLADWMDSLGFNGEAAREIMLHVCAEPANYVTYAGGYLEFMELRAAAEEALGDGFDAKEFHTLLLDLGPAPFGVLGERLDAWLDGQAEDPLAA